MLIKAATAYVGGKFRKVDILLREERIAKVANSIKAEGEQILNASDLIALPGLIDIHAHLREPGQTQKEDFLSGSKAALAGGYTLVYDMPNNIPVPTITKAALEEKKYLARKALCEIRFHFGATETNFSDVQAANPESLKMYLGSTTGNLALKDDDAAYRHMMEFPHERQIIVHSQSEGKNKQEDEASVRKAVTLAKTIGRKVHLTHLSTSKELAKAKEWRLATTDTAPHYMFLSEDDGEKMKRGRSLVNPPLREKADVAEMWNNLENIDAIATDHAPHLLEEKEQGARGFPGLETAISLFLDASAKKLVSLEWIAQRFCENPARIMGLIDYGRIAEGCFANITLIDLKKEWKVRGEDLYTKCKWSPFEGKKLKGKVVFTIYKGKIAFPIS